MFGFDVDRTSALATSLRAAAQDSGRRSAALRALLDEGNALAGQPGTPLQRVGSWLGLSSAECRGVDTIASDAPDLATEIGRRLTQLLSCKALLDAGFVVDPGSVFLDELPADPKEVTEALASFRASLEADPGMNGNHDDMRRAVLALSQLGGAEMDAAVAALDDGELRELNGAISKGDGVFASNGLDHDERLELANLLFSKVGTAGILRLSTFVPTLQPALSEDALSNYPEIRFAPASGPLIVDGVDVQSDLNQGYLGDCWFLAALGSVTSTHPDFVAEHVTENANGTFTVKLYRDDGTPVEVTVTSDLPTIGTTADPRLVFARSPERMATGELWLAVYEKAFAQYKGSYGAIEGGHGDWAMPVITGNPAERQAPSDFTLEEVATHIGEGDVMTLGTTNDKTLWWGDDDHRIAEGRIVSNHEYVVQSVDLDATPPTITVLNPWGSRSSAQHIVTVTESEFHQYFDGISIGRAAS